MDIPSLIAALGACTSPDPAVRKAGEDALNQVSIATCRSMYIRRYKAAAADRSTACLITAAAVSRRLSSTAT
jgi:hypothetical protein